MSLKYLKRVDTESRWRLLFVNTLTSRTWRESNQRLPVPTHLKQLQHFLNNENFIKTTRLSSVRVTGRMTNPANPGALEARALPPNNDV